MGMSRSWPGATSRDMKQGMFAGLEHVGMVRLRDEVKVHICCDLFNVRKHDHPQPDHPHK